MFDCFKAFFFQGRTKPPPCFIGEESYSEERIYNIPLKSKNEQLSLGFFVLDTKLYKGI
jgi:hypothetical protein